MTNEAELLEAIYQNCLECSGGDKADVGGCLLSHCTLWPYRLEFDPSSPPGSESDPSPEHSGGQNHE